jgi:hypothetical protein
VAIGFDDSAIIEMQIRKCEEMYFSCAGDFIFYAIINRGYPEFEIRYIHWIESDHFFLILMAVLNPDPTCGPRFP